MPDLRVSHRDGLLSVRLTKPQEVAISKASAICEEIVKLTSFSTPAKLTQPAKTAFDALVELLGVCSQEEVERSAE